MNLYNRCDDCGRKFRRLYNGFDGKFRCYKCKLKIFTCIEYVPNSDFDYFERFNLSPQERHFLIRKYLHKQTPKTRRRLSKTKKKAISEEGSIKK